MHGVPEDTPASIFVWSFQPANHASGSTYREILTTAVSNFPHIKLVLPSRLQRQLALSPYRALKDRIRWVKRKFANEQYGAIYFSHDASADRTAQIMMQAFPKAQHVCFGDPPGFLYSPYGFNGCPHSVGNWIKRNFWKSRLRGIEEQYEPVHSIIAVNFQQKEYEGTIEMLPHDILMDNLSRISAGLSDMLGNTPLKLAGETEEGEFHYVLLLSNFSESGLTRTEDELQMYTEICREHVPPGSLILIKPHFGTRSYFAKQLLERLSNYRAVLLPQLVQQIPIELMPELISGCTVLSVSSSSVLLSYLFQEAIIHALTPDLIRRYFKASAMDYMIDANERIRMNTLDTAERVAYK